MIIGILLFALAATDISFGVASLGVFWPVFAFTLLAAFATAKLRLPMTFEGGLLLISIGLALGFAVLLNPIAPESLAYISIFTLYGFWICANAAEIPQAVVSFSLKAIILTNLGTAAFAWLVIMTGINVPSDFLLARVYVNINSGEMRPLCLTSEPSYAAFVVAMSWLAMVRRGIITALPGGGGLKWTAVALACLSMLLSLYGYLLILIVIFVSLNVFVPKNKIYIIVISVLVVVSLAVIAKLSDLTRVFIIFNAIRTGNLDLWLVEDTSSFFRLGPTVTYFLAADFGDLQTWFGHGTRSSGYYFFDLFSRHIDATSGKVELGFFPAFVYDFGIFPSVFFAAFITIITKGAHRGPMIVMLLLLLFNANFSTQMLWFGVTCALLSRKVDMPQRVVAR